MFLSANTAKRVGHELVKAGRAARFIVKSGVDREFSHRHSPTAHGYMLVLFDKTGRVVRV